MEIERSEPPPLSEWAMACLAVAVGVIAGFGAVVFRAMIAGFHNLLFLGQLSWSYDANLHTAAAPWGVLVILAPMIGAVGVAFIVGTFASEAKGHGVPEVMEAIYYKEGRIRPAVAVVKSIASALSIGSGGSVGREGPIVQIGAAFGSTLGQWISMPAHQRIVLVAAGAGAGIAATFNAPMGGIAFAIELMLPAVTARSLLSVAIAIIVATRIGQAFFGVLPSFNVGALAVMRPDLSAGALPWFLIIGLATGVVATVMTRAIYWFEDRFDAMPGNYYTRHVLGMAVVGLIFVGFMTWSTPIFGQPNHYYVQGVGYATILDILRGDLTAPVFLLALAAAKLLVTCLTLGSGASGGVFSPALFLGAAVGAALGGLLQGVAPGLALAPTHFAIAGMAGMIAGTTGATITAIVMVFEMTWDYGAILPIMLTAAVAYVVRQHLSPASIYTLKLLRRGDVVPQGLQAWLLGARRAEDVMSVNFTVGEASPVQDPPPTSGDRPAPLRVVAREGRIAGVTPDDTGRGFLRHVVVEPQDKLGAVLRAMTRAGAAVALVSASRTSGSPRDLVGVITDREIAATTRATAHLME